MNKVRAKFKVQSIVDGQLGQATVVLHPVYDNNCEENKAFWAATPSGKVEMTITNPDAASLFEAGAEYYLDFTKIEPVQVAEQDVDANAKTIPVEHIG